MAMITQAELEASLETLPIGQDVTIGTGDADHRGWFRGTVLAHDVASGRLVVTCFMDRLNDRPLEPGERVIVSAARMEEDQAAEMDVEHCSGGPEPTVELRMAGTWQPEDERRNRVRVRVAIRASRARRWFGGAWHDLEATLLDLSSRGVGLCLDHEVRVGDRLSVAAPLSLGSTDLRATIEVRYVHLDPHVELGHDIMPRRWFAGGPFRNLSPADHERVVRFLFAQIRANLDV